MPSHILTNKLKYFDFHNPEQHTYDVEEIAHSLSHVCRYTGHVRNFYSVAQHSVLVSLIVPKHLQKAGLLHDASEAYLGDVSSPLKALLPDYKAIEAKVEKAICKQFNLPFPLPSKVKEADLIMLVTEKRDLMGRGPGESDRGMWPDIMPLHWKINPLPPAAAKALFLARWENIEAQGE